VLRTVQEAYIYPAKHFVLPQERIESAIKEIQNELDERLQVLQSEGKLLESQRLSARTRYDIELLEEVGFCPGIENYSRALAGRKPGERRQIRYWTFSRMITFYLWTNRM